VERKVEKGLDDKFWLVITGTPGHMIQCTVRGYSEWYGKVHYNGVHSSYTDRTALVTHLLPSLGEGDFDNLACSDQLTGEVQYFTLKPWNEPYKYPRFASETKESTEWMKKHGLKPFHYRTSPLYGRKGSMKDLPTGSDGLSVGERWMYYNGHPPIYSPKYVEYDGYTTSHDAKAMIPWKQDLVQEEKHIKRILNRKRAKHAYVDALRAGVDHDNKQAAKKAAKRKAAAAKGKKGAKAGKATGKAAAKK